MTSSTIVGLPAELRSLMLCHCSDFKTLANLILTCHAFHDVYSSERAKILLRVFDSAVPRDVQHDAVCVLVCRKNRRDRSRLLSVPLFHQELVNRVNDLLPLQPGSAEFLQVVRNHAAVAHLADDLRDRCFGIARRQGYMVADREPSLSYDETIRIQRAIYRTEIYNSFLVDAHHAADIRDQCLSSYPPWELDELGCVYDYLCTRMAAISERVSEAGLRGASEYFRCASSQPALPSRGISHWIDPFFLDGLETCHQVVLVDGQDRPELERLEEAMIIFDTFDYDDPLRGRRGLACALIEKQGISEDLPCVQANYIAHRGLDGPNAAWMWRRDGQLLDWYHYQDEDLAEWCSSVWDQLRLQRWRVLEKPRHYKALAHWSSSRRERLEAGRHDRMLNGPSKWKRSPCAHGTDIPTLPPRKGMLWYRRIAEGDMEWSTCKACYEESERGSIVRDR